MKKKYQHGVGLMEVLVALILLSIAVLGFAALQMRAVTASIDAGNNIQATNLARDLAERIRINREGFVEFKDKDGFSTKISATKNCDLDFCTAREMALFDFAQVNHKVENLGMAMAIRDCQGTTLNRKCIYVAWESTTPTNGVDPTDGKRNTNCTNGVAYVAGAKCIILETYNYE